MLPLPEVKDKLKWAYLAGLIDGEGTIRIHKQTVYGYNPYFHLRLIISNTSADLMTWLTLNFGGSIDSKGVTSSDKKYMGWYVSAKDVKKVIENTYSFLVVKKKQVQVALNYIYCKDRMGGEVFYLEMKELNKRGKDDDDSERSG